MSKIIRVALAGAGAFGIKHLDGISDADIVGINIPNGQPLVYELDASLKALRHSYLEPQA